MKNDDIIEMTVNLARCEMLERYDEGDPSMSALGEDAWHDQVEKAICDLEERLKHEFEIVNACLTNGDYYTSH